jgi:hypothetical protein
MTMIRNEVNTNDNKKYGTSNIRNESEYQSKQNEKLSLRAARAKRGKSDFFLLGDLKREL